MDSKTILYVEDNFHNRRIVRRILASRDYTVLEAEDGISGLEKARASKPPLILLDISLPGIDGLEVLAKIREDEALKKTPIIALTASAMRGDRERFLAAGCDAYLSKPVRAMDLLNTVAKHYPENGR